MRRGPGLAGEKTLQWSVFSAERARKPSRPGGEVMVEKVNCVSVFLSSPSDAAEERDAVKRIVEEINVDLAIRKGYYINLLTWETHSSSGVATSAQTVISTDIGSTYDIYLGVMRARFGTPTDGYGSGTEFEFVSAMNRVQKGDPVKILFFFYNGLLPLAQIDGAQVSLIANFKRAVGEQGCRYEEYDSAVDFSQKLRRNLLRRVDEVLSGRIHQDVKSETIAIVEDKLSNLNRIAMSDPEVAIAIHGRSAKRKLKATAADLNSIQSSTARTAKTLERALAALKAAEDRVRPPNFGLLKKLIDSAEQQLFISSELYIDIMSGSFEKNFAEALSETQRFVYIAIDRGLASDSDVNGLIDNMKKLVSTLRGASNKIGELEVNLAPLNESYSPGGASIFVALRFFAACCSDLRSTFTRMCDVADDEISHLENFPGVT